ncbi:MAG: ComEC/Rec2 family competence protein [Pseudomonadota bacterium]
MPRPARASQDKPAARGATPWPSGESAGADLALDKPAPVARWPGRYAAAAVTLRSLAAPLLAEQDRWVLWLPVAMGAGALLYFHRAAEPSWALALLPALLLAAFARAWSPGALRLVAGGIALAMAFGFAAAKVRTALVAAPVIAKPLYNVAIGAYVITSEPRPGGAQRLVLEPYRIASIAPGALPARIRVTVFPRALAQRRGSSPAQVPPNVAAPSARDKPATTTVIEPGAAIALTARLSPPAGPISPGAFDYRRFAFFQRLGAIGFTRDPPKPDVAPPAPSLSVRLIGSLQQVRSTIAQRVRAALPGQTGAIAVALLTGERGGISEETNTAYRNSGLFHILSISGLHMTIMAGAIFFALRAVLAAVPAIALRFPIKKWGALGALLGAFAYLMISGGSYATIRAGLMIAVMLLAILLDRPALALRNVAVAAVIILALFPESVLDVGFQMSFAAVTALVAVYEGYARWRLRREIAGASEAAEAGPSVVLRGALFFGGVIATTLIASLAVAPFALYHFHTAQQFAVIANLIVVPICNFVIMPAALVSLIALPLGLEAGPLWVMGEGVTYMSWAAARVSALPGAVHVVPAITQTGFALMVIGGLWFLLWAGAWRALGLVVVAAGVIAAPGGVRPDVLIARDGRVVAARASDGQFHILPSRAREVRAHRRRVRTTRAQRAARARGPVRVTGPAGAARVPAGAGERRRKQSGPATVPERTVLPTPSAQPDQPGRSAQTRRTAPPSVPAPGASAVSQDGRAPQTGARVPSQTKRPQRRPAGTYILSRWLKRDGDQRDPKAVAAARWPLTVRPRLRCDGVGCVIKLKGAVIAMPRRYEALRDDCARATIIITRLSVPRGCAGRQRAFDGDRNASAPAPRANAKPNAAPRQGRRSDKDPSAAAAHSTAAKPATDIEPGGTWRVVRLATPGWLSPRSSATRPTPHSSTRETTHHLPLIVDRRRLKRTGAIAITIDPAGRWISWRAARTHHMRPWSPRSDAP